MKKPKAQDLQIEISFLEALRKRLEDDVDVLKLLGNDYTKIGRWEEGLKVDLELAKLSPDDPLIQYNLACSLSLMNQLQKAGQALVRAIELGYDDWKWISEDPDLDNLRKTKDFEPIGILFQKSKINPKSKKAT